MKNIKVRESPEFGSGSDSDSDLSYDSGDLPAAAPPPLKYRKVLSKQLSMRETKRERAWEERRIQILREELETEKRLTDGDLIDLMGSIELGFGFKEEDGQELCQTLPALDLYFAVNRQLGLPPSPNSASTSTSSACVSPKSPNLEFWKILNPGDKPQNVKTRLRHWAQAVACSVRQCS